MQKSKKYIVGGVIVLIAVLILGYVYFMSAGVYYYNVGELLGKDPPLTGQTLRVSGVLLPDPSEKGLTWYFAIKDVETEDTLDVVYSGPIPNTFKVGEQLVVEGQYNATSGIFESSSIIVKCASKYEPAT